VGCAYNPEGAILAPIYVKDTGGQWVINGTDCIDNGGLGKQQIYNDVKNLPQFTVETYQEFYDMGYIPVNAS
jgi:hypothetical protein